MEAFLEVNKREYKIFIKFNFVFVEVNERVILVKIARFIQYATFWKKLI